MRYFLNWISPLYAIETLFVGVPLIPVMGIFFFERLTSELREYNDETSPSSTLVPRH